MTTHQTALLATLVMTFGTCTFYPLPDAKLTPNQVCGQPACQPGNVGRILNFTKNPYSPGIKVSSSARDIAYAVLGHTINSGDITGSDINTCSETSANPFSKDDIENIRFTDGRVIEYTKTEKLNIDIQAAADANVKELMKLTLDTTKIEKLEAKIIAAYQRINGKDLKIVGKYSEWGLTFDALEKIKKGDGFQSCRAYIDKNNQRIITAVGLVYFDITYNENSLDSLAAEIDGELVKEGLIGSISFSFKREVSKNLKATSNGVFQILVWRHARLVSNTLTSE